MDIEIVGRQCWSRGIVLEKIDCDLGVKIFKELEKAIYGFVDSQSEEGGS